MLAAIRSPATRIIAGGYVLSGGGVCPLLAAHRRGGRAYDESTATLPFASAWDRFTQTRDGEPREIGARERSVLEATLVATSWPASRVSGAARLRPSWSVPSAHVAPIGMTSASGRCGRR